MGSLLSIMTVGIMIFYMSYHWITLLTAQISMESQKQAK